MSLKAMIFDMDGLMADTEPLHFKSFNIILKKINQTYSFSPDEGNIGGGTEINDWIYLREKYNITYPMEELMEKRFKTFKSIAQNLKPKKGLMKLLKNTSGYKLALASSSGRKYIEFILKKIDIYNRFNFIISAEDKNVKNGKPSPDIYFLTAKKLGCEPEECLVLEDSLNGLMAAKNAGMKCFVVPSSLTDGTDFSQADSIFKSLNEITLEQMI